MRTTPLAFCTTLTAFALAGCQPESTPAPADPHPPTANAATPEPTEYPLPTFVGKVWISTTPGKPRGTIKVFLPDKTLLMDSCFETFRIAQWGVVSEESIRWLEDSIPIEAKYEQPTADSLRLSIAGQPEAETYVTASAPYVCPDVKR